MLAVVTTVFFLMGAMTIGEVVGAHNGGVWYRCKISGLALIG